MELRKIEYKNSEEKSCILVVESENGSELTVKQDSWHQKIRPLIFGFMTDTKLSVTDDNGNEVDITSIFNKSLVFVMQKLLGVDFLFFSLTKKAPSKNSPFLYVISFAYDSNLRGYESRTTVKDIEVNLELNLKEAIEATEKRLGELDTYKEAEQIKDCQNRIGHYQLFIDLIDAVKDLEEAIADNWHEISESNNTSKQLDLWKTTEA